MWQISDMWRILDFLLYWLTLSVYPMEKEILQNKDESFWARNQECVCRNEGK